MPKSRRPPPAFAKSATASSMPAARIAASSRSSNGSKATTAAGGAAFHTSAAGRGTGLPQARDGAGAAGVRVREQGQALGGERGRELLQQVDDGGADRPVGQQAEHDVRPAAAQRAGRRR